MPGDLTRPLDVGYLRNERPGQTLQCTGLVHEMYIRLVKMDGVRWQDRAQYISAQMVRHILVDHARRRRRQSGDATVVPLDDAFTIPARQDLDVEALDPSLEKLASIDERKAQIVQLRYFAGLSVKEAAEVIGCSRLR